MDQKQKELLRKSFHFLSILVPISYRYIFHSKKQISLQILLVLAIVAISVEYFRLENKTFRKLFYTVFGVMLRRHEIYNLSGASFLLTSAIFCIAFYPPDIAFLSLCFVSIGDIFAALIGISFGKRKFTFAKKSLEGSIACFVSTFTLALFYIHPIIAFLGSLGATVAEAVNLPIDDNVRIPVFSGFVMIITYFFTLENINVSQTFYRLFFR
ncbi:MAG: diacylglycerol/polyprenol kinase family protein [Candidatus Cloacimonadales bacterium]|jgi:dolichol kinase|nr:SEC59/DGK1/VTE5 family protein [Candidatus Cloacimonadota bacterium]